MVLAWPVKETLGALCWNMLSHPLYSPDAALSNYYLFCSIQCAFYGRWFISYAKIKKWTLWLGCFKATGLLPLKIHLLLEASVSFWQKMIRINFSFILRFWHTHTHKSVFSLNKKERVHIYTPNRIDFIDWVDIGYRFNKHFTRESLRKISEHSYSKYPKYYFLNAF